MQRVLLVLLALCSVSAFRPVANSARSVLSLQPQHGRAGARVSRTSLQMSDLVLAAMPTIEEWLDVADPKLKKTTIAMFRACKEIAYKIRTASCDKVGMGSRPAGLYY